MRRNGLGWTSSGPPSTTLYRYRDRRQHGDDPGDHGLESRHLLSPQFCRPAESLMPKSSASASISTNRLAAVARSGLENPPGPDGPGRIRRQLRPGVRQLGLEMVTKSCSPRLLFFSMLQKRLGGSSGRSDKRAVRRPDSARNNEIHCWQPGAGTMRPSKSTASSASRPRHRQPRPARCPRGVPTFVGLTPGTVPDHDAPWTSLETRGGGRWSRPARRTAYQGHWRTPSSMGRRTCSPWWRPRWPPGLLARMDDAASPSAPLPAVPPDWQQVKRTTPVIHRLADPGGAERPSFSADAISRQHPEFLLRGRRARRGRRLTETGLVGEVAPKTILSFDGGKS